MANRVKQVTASAADRAELERRMRSQTGQARDAKRAQIVLLAAEGWSGVEIAERVGVSEPMLIKWRRAYADRGLAGLADRLRSGRPREITPEQRFAIWFISQHDPPVELGLTHWSLWSLARDVGIDHATIARLWRQWGLQPWRLTTFKRSTDPEFEAKLRDVVWLFLHPPDKAIVLSVDEKSQIQALDRTQPMLSVRPGLPASRPHDYVRPGTTTLFAALEVATGKVTDACYDRHRHQEFLKFLSQVAKATRASAAPRGRQLRRPPSMRTSASGWPSTRGSRCTSRRRRPAGSIWSRRSSPSSPARPSPRQPRLRRRAHRRHPHLHRRLQRALRTVHLNQDCRRNPRQAQATNDFSDGSLG